ncbi:MAG: rRNA pseudouridine synthase [Ardenticatenales bacterium]|nr:rRNA pseudouridine synthase [Ardenticatenales bacterium]
MEERLNKVLARAGLASRRGADELIEAGRVTVNGQVVTELGLKVDIGADDIRLDGERIRAERGPDRYVALYKPRHVITTVSDPYDRPTVMDFVQEGERLFPVGRLDGNSEGLLLLTNDGELANQLAHPQYEHEKEYRVKISGTPSEKALKAWREGVWLEDGRTQPAHVTIESSSGPSSWVRFVLKEGKNRQIRRMVEAFNHKIFYLIRTRMGPITLGDMKPGEWRYLSAKEMEALRVGSTEAIQYGEQPKGQAVPKEKTKYKEGWARPKPRNSRPKPKGAPSTKRGKRK